mmetsp:Transcript_9878/g.20704  ORF Transcript_9878/g.20704 Transcript_9878/m.20704 type:complete len:230 (+) Transcript_9878:41-730(+)
MLAWVVQTLLLAGAMPVVASLEVAKGIAIDVATVGGPSSCGAESSVSDCDKLDIGSCGTACCALEISSPETPEVVYNKVKNFLTSGGASGGFAYVTGPNAAGENPGDDLRQYNSTPPRPFEFILQGTHTSLLKKFVDTLNFNIRPDSATTGSVLRMFSSSGIHGALGDQGQNYKSLVYVVDSLGFDRSSLSAPLYGCGSTSGAEAKWVSWMPALIGACLLMRSLSSVTP